MARKKIACVVTEYRVPAHSDVLIGKFINGFPTDDGMEDPQVDIASMYIDQFPESDIGRAVCAENDIPLYNSIVEALCLGDPAGGLAVDGVIVIGECVTLPHSTPPGRRHHHLTDPPPDRPATHTQSAAQARHLRHE